MDVKKLFKGIAVVIDDEIHDVKSSIYNILNQLKTESIPYVEYDSIPDVKIADNLQNVSFVLLDWKLDSAITDSEIISGVKLPAEEKKSNVEENIKFLKAIQKVCFCPIFIFTDEEISSIQETLKHNGLYRDGKCNTILIKSKSVFISAGSLFTELESWLKETLSIYLLKSWDATCQTAKINLFLDFQKRSPLWTKVLWDTYIKDGVNPSLELGDFISKSILGQMIPLSLENSYFNDLQNTISAKELIDCLERQCFVDEKFLEKAVPETGDIFMDGGVTYINIRPSCDLIPRKEGSTIDDVELYLLQGEKVNDISTKKSSFFEKYGHFPEKDSNFIVFPILRGSFVEFSLKDITKEKWSNMKSKRKGRLLHPYLTKLQIKYGAYIQRQGLPCLPNQIFNSSGTL
ncbi:hypothetical protein [Treponema sp.]|uniref:hypothetical protein n=1 Tax=Treponema sp. TaxID=166 RepID=UPI00388D1B08